jgi:ubiquinone biosynthesis protein
LDPEFKQALTSLEDRVDSITYEDLLATIEKETQRAEKRYRIEVKPAILAEASVCAVVRADVYVKGKKRPLNSVLKVVKPYIRQNLATELDLFDRLADFLDHNKTKWGLGDFRFRQTLDQVQWLLKNEINLTLEQANLKTARRYFPARSGLAIPKRLPCSTPSMTVMTRIEGRKITDVAGLDVEQKRQLAAALAETCLVRPVKDLGDVTIFHGDPHAGNIAYTFEKSNPRIILYDWGMMGRLSRLARVAMALMAMGSMAKSSRIILYAADIIAARKISSDADVRTAATSAVQNVLDRRRTWTGHVLDDISALIGELSYHGAVFPTDMLMFQKAMITLKGVIADIDPSFTDDQLLWIALSSQIRDLYQISYHWKISKELVAFGRYSTTKLIKLHWQIVKVAFEMGLLGIYLTLPRQRHRTQVG